MYFIACFTGSEGKFYYRGNNKNENKQDGISNILRNFKKRFSALTNRAAHDYAGEIKRIISLHSRDVCFKPKEMPSFQRSLCLPCMEEFMENGRLTVNFDDDFSIASKGTGELIIIKIGIGKTRAFPKH